MLGQEEQQLLNGRLVMKDAYNSLLTHENIEFAEISKETVLSACINTHMEYFVSIERDSCTPD